MKNTNAAGSGLLLGLLTGAVLALLFAPKKGSETRSDIAKASKKTAETTSRYFNRVERKAGKVQRDILSQIETLVDQVREGDNDARQQLDSFLDNLDNVARKS